MKVAHLILAHNTPAQLERLVSHLTYAGDAVYIHLDKKADIASFSRLANRPDVHFIHKRVQIAWGGYSMVQATLNGFQQIISSGIEYGYVNLLSGADYPLQSAEALHRFLEAHPGKAFMTYLSFEKEWPEALPRITNYYLTDYDFPGRYWVERYLNRVLPKRVLPDGLIPVGRSQWFTASTHCIQYILDYWNRNARLRHFTKFTWGSDEFIFQTILYNSPLRDCMVNKNLRYIDWSAKAVSPKTLTLKDKEALLASDKFFARKFDMINHPQILDVIDQKLRD